MDTHSFTRGKLYINDKCINVEELQWNEHPEFKGVFLKHLIKGEKTRDQLSCHLVKINANCEIGLHHHRGKTELHEVLDGAGICMIEQQKLNYQKGVTGFIPEDKNHIVKAGTEGLLLIAKFFPALL